MMIKIHSSNWQRLFCLFAFFFAVETMHGAAVPFPTKFIIVAKGDPSYGLESFIKNYGNTLSATLGLEPNSTMKILISAENIFEQIPPDPIEHPCVIISEGNNAGAVINAFEKVSRPPKAINSIILFDPRISGETNLDYSRIINRVYNFYSEVTAYHYRKINSRYDTTKNKLKGLNIKCEYINELGARLPLNFDNLFIPVDPKKQLAFLGKIIDAIRELETYKVENDFHCVLFSMNDTVLPNRSCPIININKRSKIENNIFQTHIMTGLMGDYYSPASERLSPGLFEKIETQRNIELKKSTDVIARFSSFIERLSLTERTFTPEFWKNWNGINDAYKNKLESSSLLGPEKVRARIGLNSECPEEQNYLRKRLVRVHDCLSKHKIIKAGDQSPLIAVVASGGGVRAMLATLGTLHGLQEIDLMDGVTYLCGLSGSTWAIGPWISSGMNINDFSAAMIRQLSESNMVNPGDLASVMSSDPQFPRIFAAITSPYSYKKTHDLPYTTVDAYAGYLQHYLLPDNLKFSYLSQQAAQISAGTLPLPIYTSIRADGKTEVIDKEAIARGLGQWYQFTPYEIGAQWLDKNNKGIFIPSWAFGRQFYNRESLNRVFEQPLALNMAIFGSAFAMSIRNAIDKVLAKIPVISNLGLIAPLIVDENRQIIAARYNNFTSGMLESKIEGQQYMQMADAGLAFNLPYPPISGEQGGRKADVIIFVDASGETVPGTQIRHVETYAKTYNRPFPDLDNHEININSLQPEPQGPFESRINQTVRIFMSYDPHVPLVIYLRFITDAPFVQACLNSNVCKVFNFVYPQKTAYAAISMMKDLITVNANAIMRAITMHHVLQIDAHLQEDLRSQQEFKIRVKKEEWPPIIHE